jgi:hypothetical protein
MERIKNFFLANEAKIVLAVGLILVAGLSFEAGLIQGKNRQNSPIIIEKTTQSQNPSLEGTAGSAAGAQNTLQEAKIDVISSNIPTQNSSSIRQDCVFVGSKNSNKYHRPTCRFAKLIKPENTVCFPSAEDATAKGYLPDKRCVK